MADGPGFKNRIWLEDFFSHDDPQKDVIVFYGSSTTEKQSNIFFFFMFWVCSALFFEFVKTTYTCQNKCDFASVK